MIHFFLVFPVGICQTSTRSWPGSDPRQWFPDVFLDALPTQCWEHLLRKYCCFPIKLMLYETEKAMAPHSSPLAWRIQCTEEPGGLQSMGSLRVGHDRATSLSLFTFLLWRRKWQSTPVFLPGDSQGRGNLVGCRLWGHTESDTTKVT